MRRDSRTQAFTVIELMIVVAVIALLAVALLPNLTGARTSANITAVHAVLTRASQAQEMYYARCASYYDPAVEACNTPGETGSDVWDNIVQWRDTDSSNVEVDWTSASTGDYCVEAYHNSDADFTYKIELNGEPTRGTCGA
jgi:prepilin-type N-terminal cleavage/methylation domain-containing protein